MENKKIKIGITQGDINSVSYEVILKTLSDKRISELCTPILYGSSKVAAYHRKTLKINNINLHRITNPDESQSNKPNIINCLDDNIRVELGKSTKIAGEASINTLIKAVKDLKENKIDALVTGPINKHNIQSENFKFPGHTDFLKDQFGVDNVLMMMINNIMKVGVVTSHVPISQVPGLITIDNILTKLRIMHKSMKTDFSIRKPKIAILGLNPHCGDEGVIGDEEEKIIIPAIEKANEENILAIGPFPTDGFFGSDAWQKFDAILAMYHDQGLTPFKALDYENGVNFTAGLPVIRTSPAHGTAFELAGENRANHLSFQQSVYAAIEIFKNRNMHKQITSNPLPDYDTTKI
jgi:4-hydroxythreonine-4-phosphate dehydrogenase